MTAAALLDELRRLGIAARADRGRLRLRPAALVTPDLAERLRANKFGVLALLIRSPWTAKDWQERFDERAASAEHDGGATPNEAARIAFDSCILEWLERHPPDVGLEVCAGCDQPLPADPQSISVLADGARVHHGGLSADRCRRTCIERRRADAAAALEALGITASSIPG